jgi:DNA-binding response OmpR family regulator
VEQTRTILVIDDDPDVLEAVEAFLRTHEYNVVTAQRWTEAITQLTDASPDAILLDLHMPTVQGEALLEFIRENYAQLPVVIISAGATPAEMARLGELGANGFIRKPFDTEDLIVILEQVLLDLATDSAPEPPSNTEPPTKQLTEADSSGGPDEDEFEDDELEDDETILETSKRARSLLPANISPGSGINNLTSMQPHQQQEARRRRKTKRKPVRKVTRLKKIRNFVAIILIFLAMGVVIYSFNQGLVGKNFLGLSFGGQTAE